MFTTILSQRRPRRLPLLRRQLSLFLLLSIMIITLKVIMKFQVGPMDRSGWTLCLLLQNITYRSIGNTTVAAQHIQSFQQDTDHRWNDVHLSPKNYNNTNKNNTKKFPPIETVIEMATLSSLIYAFHTEDYGNDDINNTVCDRINHALRTTKNSRVREENRRRRRSPPGTRNARWQVESEPASRYVYAAINNRTIPPNIHCEWYHHDWIDGTQIMIVSASESTSTSDHDRSKSNSITIIFGGTDDMTTSLTDVDVLLSPFGYPKDTSNINTTLYPIYNVTLSDPNIRIHAGFDTTLFNARNLFGEIVSRVEQIRLRMMRDDSNRSTTRKRKNDGENTNKYDRDATRSPHIYTTGHSLGGGYSILMAIGLTQYYENVRHSSSYHHYPPHRSSTDVTVPEEIMVINFGCPQIGNVAFRDYIHTSPLFPSQRLHIFRYVLGWDIVPRLPTLLQHVGHTIQLSTTSNRYAVPFDTKHAHTTAIAVPTNGSSSSNTNITTAAYYHHIGNVTLQYSSVPFGWSATPFIWIPGAITAHYITAYIQCLLDLQQQLLQQQQQNSHGPNDPHQSNDTNSTVWIIDFERSVPISNRTIYDDDYYIEPPNDDFITATTTMK